MLVRISKEEKINKNVCWWKENHRLHVEFYSDMKYLITYNLGSAEGNIGKLYIFLERLWLGESNDTTFNAIQSLYKKNVGRKFTLFP